MGRIWWVNPKYLCHEKPFEGAVRVQEHPDLNERCRSCGHRLEDHHWDGNIGGRCCAEVDRYELCQCKKFRERELA